MNTKKPRKEKAVKAVKSVKAEPVVEVKAEPEVFEVYAIGVCPNPMWLRGMTCDTMKCNIQVPKASMRDGLVGKWMKATKIDGVEENHYKFLA
jgi:hypothetical protein